MKDFLRMRVESHHYALPIQSRSLCLHVVEHTLMPQMYAIERSDCDNWVAKAR